MGVAGLGRVWRSTLEAALDRAAEQVTEARVRAGLAEQREALARSAFERADAERADLQGKLLKVLSGVHPFAEETAATAAAAAAPQEPEPTPAELGLTGEQALERYVKEGLRIYGGKLPRAMQYGRQKLAGMEARRAVLADPQEAWGVARAIGALTDAIEQGQRS